VTIESGEVTDQPVPANPDYKEPRHIWRMVAIWAVLSVILDPLFYFLVGPTFLQVT